MRVAIVSQGEELLNGEVVNTNSAWLAEQCWANGVQVRRMVTAGDDVSDICWALDEAAKVAGLVLCTGGLGPTSDDLTAESVARWMGNALAEDPQALAQIEARFASWGRTMVPTNRKQALMPEGAKVLENRWGTAPGFAVDHAGTRLICLPGVPAEMRRMFEVYGVSTIRALRTGSPPKTHRIRTIGLGESRLQECLDDMDLGGATLGFRSHLPEVQVKLQFPETVAPDVQLVVVQRVVKAIGRGVYNVDGGDLAEEAGRRLVLSESTLALAESCTAGALAAWLASVAGASRYLLEGAVLYSNAAKIRVCGVEADSIETHGAVSEPVARQLAAGIRDRVGSTYGIGITGIAGPGGATAGKPVGTMHIAVAGPDRVDHHCFRFPGGRLQVTRRAAGMAISMLLEMMESMD